MTSTLADQLRALPDDGLAALIRLRPDLVVPVPADFSALTVRVQSRVSVARALDGLDRFTLEILDALRYARDDSGTAPVEAVLALTAPAGVDPTRTRSAIDQLRSLFLVYGQEHALHVIAGVDEVCSPYPAGLGRRATELDAAAAALVSDAAGLRRTLLAAPPNARAALDRLAAGPPVGTVTAASLAPDSDSPVRWLVERSLLVAVADDAVELPREVALLLRRDTGPLGALHPNPPEIDAPAREVAAVNRSGAGQAMETVRSTEALLEALAAEPATTLRGGGLGVRDLRRLARAATLDEPTAALLIEIAYAAGLIGEASAAIGAGRGRDASSEPARSETGESLFLPAAGYDAWRACGIAASWHRLAYAWLAMGRAPGLVGQRDDRDRLINVLAPEAERPGAPAQRRAALDVLAGVAPGAAPAASAVVEQLTWRSPRRAARGSTLRAEEVLNEAALLGLTGLGALTDFGRQLLAESTAGEPGGSADDEDPLGIQAVDRAAGSGSTATLDGLLPAPVDHVVLQADLTLVVPGPAEPSLATELALVADAESTSVFRITTDSVRRCLDAGYTAADLHVLFARRSRTPVPQALTYLIDDVARRHGGLRIGSAGAYLRSEDEALIAEVLVDRRLTALNLRRLAPTVLVTPLAAGRLLGVLREAGYAPVAEDATGAAVVSRPRSRRAAARPPAPVRRFEDALAVPRLPAPRLAGIVEQIRRGDAAARAARRAPVTVRTNGAASGAQAHTQALAVLQQALRDRSRVWVGYVDAHGAPASRLVRPVSMGSGYLRAEDERTEMLHTFALHRITAAVLEDQ
jgi:hypothetical protein